MITGIDALSIVRSVKVHLSDRRFDAKKYHFKTKVTKSTWHADNLAKNWMMTRDRFIDFVVANVIDDNTWIGDMSESSYHGWLLRGKTLSYTFTDEVTNFLSYHGGKEACFPCEPVILLERLIMAVARGDMSYETATILCDIMNLRDVEVDSLMEDSAIRLVKYVDFLRIDRDKFLHLFGICLEKSL